ncbi:hypothetical protein LBO01_15330 [Companilactobacillus paralimentarius]|nr:hypothetical protein ATN92_15945 [Companilactobacillus bobalius]KAE9563788.1 hypothetical protein ATN92_03395 [Companilactobacillus bobalius]GEO58404.1 hypothetical protein LBO01_15330 [Companilactobacillus paralimentarius]
MSKQGKLTDLGRKSYVIETCASKLLILWASLFLWDVLEPLRELRDDLPSTFLPIRLSLKISLIFISRVWKISAKSFYDWTKKICQITVIIFKM